MASSRENLDYQTLMIKNIPSHLPLFIILDTFMRDPNAGVWACNPNRRRTPQPNTSSIIGGQYFVNFLTKTSASEFRVRWNGQMYHGNRLLVEYKTLMAGQKPTAPSPRDWSAWQGRQAAFQQASSPMHYGMEFVPAAQSGHVAEAPAVLSTLDPAASPFFVAALVAAADPVTPPPAAAAVPRRSSAISADSTYDSLSLPASPLAHWAKFAGYWTATPARYERPRWVDNEEYPGGEEAADIATRAPMSSEKAVTLTWAVYDWLQAQEGREGHLAAELLTGLPNLDFLN